MADFDAIVVGSGAGGLAAALKIAQHDYSVLVLEAAQTYGGCLSPFEINGYAFDLGVHYLGQLAEGDPFWRNLEQIGLQERVKFVELDPDAIDRYVFPDFELRLCKGKECFKEQLIELFPNERAGIDKFFRLYDLITRANERFLEIDPTPMHFLRWLVQNPVMLKYGRVPYQALLDAVTSDIRLQTALAAPWFDYMLPPVTASVSYGIGTWHHYLSGGYYPLGGSRGLRDTLVETLRSRGGRLESSSKVTAIGRRDDEFVVTIATGTQVTARAIVSDVDPTITIGELIESTLLSHRVRDKARRLWPSGSVFGLLVGTDLDLPSLGMTSGNLVHYGGYDINRLFRETMADKDPCVSGAVFINSPTVRDPAGGLAPQGHHSLEILVGANYAAFEAWAHLPAKKRDAAYDSFVGRLREQLLSVTDRYIPNLSQHLQLTEIVTPLTLENRLNLVRGGVYGPELTPDQMGLGRFPGGVCGVRGLFLAGAGARGSSVRYCMISGIEAGQKAVSHIRRH